MLVRIDYWNRGIRKARGCERQRNLASEKFRVHDKKIEELF